MLTIKITGVAFLILGCCLFLPAQSNYQVQRFTTDNGLPSNGIKGLQWDEETGFLWIATEAGVTRYNGIDFMTFSKDNMPDMYSDRMLFLLKNQEGRICTSDEVGNVFFVMQNRLQFMEQVKIDARPSTFRLVGLFASGQLFRQSARQPPANFGFNFFTEEVIPLSERRMILLHGDSLYDYRLGDRDPVLLTPIEPGSRIFHLGKDLFVFNPAHGFYRLDPDTFLKMTPVKLTGDAARTGKVKELLFWDNGMKNPVLIAGPNAWILDYQNGQLVSRLICSAIPTDVLLGFLKYSGKNGLLFLGTNSRGIIVIRKNSILPMKKATAIPDQTTACYSQLALPNGAIETNQGDVIGDPAPSPARLPITGLFNNFILTTADSSLWYSQKDTAWSYSWPTHQRTSFPTGAGSITDGFVLSRGAMYIANAIGIGILQNGHIHYLYNYPTADINSNVPFSMIELSPGEIAIASCNGLLRFNTVTCRLDTLFHIPGVCVRALWKYKGYTFIGTYGKGIWLYKDGVLKPIPIDKGRYLLYAHCFVPDKLGYCWISTNKGLFRARPEDMIDAFEKDQQEIYYHYYGRADGLEMTELNGGCTPCALQLNDTTLSFPSMDGLAWVNPTRPISGLPDGAIYIDDFSADGQKVNTTSIWRPDLPSNTRDLVFALGFPAWVNKENLNIEYKLDPYIKEWQPLEIANNPKLYFSNLPSGSYRLLLRKKNGFGPKNYSYTEENFRIAPRWYAQPWAWLLGLCLLTGSIIGIVWLRTRQFKIRQGRLERQIAEKTRELQAKNEELEKTDDIKTRLISIISHDLITPLKFLHLTGKSLIEKKNVLPEDLQREAITEITTTSKELELLSTNILNWIKYRNEDRRLAKENFNLHGLVAQLFGIFNAMAREKQIRLRNEVNKLLMPYQFIEPVKIVLYNLILNGINFTHEGYILVSSIVTPDGISLVVEDTGVGMTQDQINNVMADHFIISSANVDNRKGNGLGYLIIKDLLKIIRGSILIQSEKGKGTRVTVRLPA
jgi:signal transduction histidine kinase